MATILKYEKAIVASDNHIQLPESILMAGDIHPGDVLAVWWLPPDQIILRKLPHALVQEEFDRAMDEFGQALHAAGYDSDEKIIELVRQVRHEQVAERIKGQG